MYKHAKASAKAGAFLLGVKEVLIYWLLPKISPLRQNRRFAFAYTTLQDCSDARGMLRGGHTWMYGMKPGTYVLDLAGHP